MLQGKQSSITISCGSWGLILSSLVWPGQLPRPYFSNSIFTNACCFGWKNMWLSVNMHYAVYKKIICQHWQICRSIPAVTNESQSDQPKIFKESQANQSRLWQSIWQLHIWNTVQRTFAESHSISLSLTSLQREPSHKYWSESTVQCLCKENPIIKTGASQKIAARLSAG